MQKNTRYKDTRSGFYFFLNDYVITFSGIAKTAVNIDEHKTLQHVDMVIFSKTKTLSAREKYFTDKKHKGPSPKRVFADGQCVSENPFRNVPTKINCLAKTKEGRFYIEFDHDGSQPKVGKDVKDIDEKSVE